MEIATWSRCVPAVLGSMTAGIRLLVAGRPVHRQARAPRQEMTHVSHLTLSHISTVIALAMTLAFLLTAVGGSSSLVIG